MAGLFDSPSGQLLERAMDITALRQELLSNNIANVNTPFYKRRDVNFAAAMAQATQNVAAGEQLPMAVTHSRHLTATSDIATSPVIVTESGTSSRYDQNNVDIENEMAQLSENSLYFQALTNSWNRESNRLKMAIEGK